MEQAWRHLPNPGTHPRPRPVRTIATDASILSWTGGGSWISVNHQNGTADYGIVRVGRHNYERDAALYALRRVPAGDPLETHLLSDAQGALGALHRILTKPKMREAAEAGRLAHLAAPPRLHWTRGHTGHFLNEAADLLARHSAVSNPSIPAHVHVRVNNAIRRALNNGPHQALAGTEPWPMQLP